MNRLSKTLIIPLLIVMIFAFGMDASAVIHSKWVAGDFIFYDATQDILTIKDDTDGLIVGETTDGVDFKAWSDTASTYLLWDADADDLLLVGTATKLNVAGTTEASASTGAIYTDGGICAKKKVYVGTNLVLVAGPLDVSTAATDIKVKSNTDSALEFVINSTAFIDIDTLNTITGITNVMFTAIASQIASDTDIWKRTVGITPGTTTLTGTTTCSNMSGLALYIAQPTLTCSDTVTVTKASTVYIVAEPVGSSVTIAAAYALEIASGNFLTAGKIIIDDQTEATASTGSIQTDGGVSITKQLFLQDDIDMTTSGDGIYEITLNNNVADALSITDATGDLILFKTSSTRAITITPNLVVTGSITCDDSTEGTASTGSIQTDGGLSVVLKAYVSGGLFLVSNAAATFLDFEIGTSWTSGTLINADFGDSTTLLGAAVGFNLDLGTNVAAASEQNVKGVDINLPTMTMTNVSTITVKAIEITAQGAFTAETAGTCVWTGVDITIPAITQGETTSVTATGVKIVGQAITTGGTVYGIALSGVYTTAVNIGGTVATGIAITACTTANIAVSGSNVIGLVFSGTYSNTAIAIGIDGTEIDLDAVDDRLLAIYGESDAVGNTVMPIYAEMITSAACKARVAEFVLAPTAPLGQWANVLKTYLDLEYPSVTGGSGLVASLCAEIMLPATTMTGTITVLELELVTPESGFVANFGAGSNCVSYITTGLAGNDKSAIDTYGYFLNVQGLASDTDHMLYNNTLRCVIGTNLWYLPFSSAPGSFTTAYPIVSSSTTGFRSTADFTPDEFRTDYAICIGNRVDGAITVTLANAANQNFEPFQMNIELAGGGASSTGTIRLIRVKSVHSAIDTPNLRIMNINTYMDVQKNIEAVYGLMHGVDFTTNTVTLTTEAAVAAFNMECVTTVVGNVRGIIINMHGANLPATSIGLEVKSDGGAATLGEGIRINGHSANSVTIGLKMIGTIVTGIDIGTVTDYAINFTGDEGRILMGTDTTTRASFAAAGDIVQFFTVNMAASGISTGLDFEHAVGYAGVTSMQATAIRGVLRVLGVTTLTGTSPVMEGASGYFKNEGIVDNTNITIAGVRGAILDGGTYTNVGIMAPLMAAWQLETGGQIGAGITTMLYLHNSVNYKVDSVFRIGAGTGSGNFGYLFNIDGTGHEGFTTEVGITHGGNWVNLKFRYDGQDFYLIGSTDPT